jgi:hypothetical protein
VHRRDAPIVVGPGGRPVLDAPDMVRGNGLGVGVSAGLPRPSALRERGATSGVGVRVTEFAWCLLEMWWRALTVAAAR